MKTWQLVLLFLLALLVICWKNHALDEFAAQLFPFDLHQPVRPASLSVTALPTSRVFELPPDTGYINVKDMGAKGDGKTDDTEALQQVFGRNKQDPGGAIRSIYIPNGVYIISNTLIWGDKRKDVWGQSRDGVVIKLRDNCPGFQNLNKPKKVLQVEFGHGGQNFNQRLRSLTVDVGHGNPGAVGIGFHTNNSGGIYDVVIRSSDPQKRGHTGLRLDKPWPGPGLVKNIYVDGFETGIFIAHDQYSMTFEHIKLAHQRRIGFVNSANTVAIRDLESMNHVQAIENRGRTAVMVLVGAHLTRGSSDVPAILNRSGGVLFARNVTTQGYKRTIDNRAGQSKQVQSSYVDEFVSHPVATPFQGSCSLQLPIEDPPSIPYGDVKNWVSVTQFGAQPDDEIDDALSIQKAIDSGAETVYFPTGLYQSGKSILVHKNVRRLLGFNANIVFRTPGQPAFIIKDGTYDAVAVDVDDAYESQHSYWIEHASKRTLVLHNGSYINTVTGGKVFIEDSTAVPFVFNQQQVWMRQVNTESYHHNPHIINRGGALWILGLKTEKDRTVVGTYDNGRTEVLGGLLYKNRERVGSVPAFVSSNSTISLVYRNKGKPYQVQVLEITNGIAQKFPVQDMPASNGRMPLYVGHSDCPGKQKTE